MQREIVLDTETTGLDPKKGDRLVEIGCVELLNRIPTGREYHVFINPEREVPQDAVNIHGLTTEFLADKPLFEKVADAFADFIADAQLVIHNAQFDIGFINMELGRVKKPTVSWDRVVDTLALARRKHPAGPNNLDALCKRYGIDNSKRIKHGALMDSFLLAQVYVELLGERQATLTLSRAGAGGVAGGSQGSARQVRQRPAPLPSRVTDEVEAAHRAFVETLGESAIWKRYQVSDTPVDAGK
jgi:DNA polymerase-3 subunit epsilon